MNKKIIAGFLSAAAVGSFWACGSGDINEPDVDDNVVKMKFVDDPNAASAIQESLIDEAKKACKNDPICMNEHGDYVQGNVTPSSTSVSAPVSSASVQPPVGGGTTTNPSTPIVIVTSSASAEAESSDDSGSTPTIVPSSSDLGTCAAITAPVDKDVPVAFKFTPNSSNTSYQALDFAKAKFEWNYGAGGVGDGTASSVNSDKVTYSTSGKKQVSVVVTMPDGASQAIACAPLQVNGDPITGCECTAATTGVDYLTTPDVAWTVTGCTSASEVNSYSWDGVDGTTSFTKTFTAATASYSPKLKVGNSDSTVIDVPCSAVKVTEGAEYTIKEANDAGKVAFPAAGSYNVVIGFACQNKVFFCNGNGAPVGGSVNGVAMESSWYTTATLTAADCSGSATVVVELTGPASCGAQ